MPQGLFSIERVVTVLSPLLAAGAAALCGWAGSHVGVRLDPGAIEGVEIAAVIGTFGVVAKWLHGRQIPAVAGLHITPAQEQEIASYIAEHGLDVEHIVEALAARLGREPPSALAPKRAADTAPTA